MARANIVPVVAVTALALHESEEHNARVQTAVRSANTQKGYASDWRAFEAWCRARGIAPLAAPGNRVAVYLSDMQRAGSKLASIERALSSIASRLLETGAPSPREDGAVRATMKGLRRTMKSAQTRKAPAVSDVLKRMVTFCSDDGAGRRDRALLCLGFAGAFRRSELVALDRSDVVFTEDGLIVRIRSGKTDQEGRGRALGIPYFSDPAVCPVRALQKHLDRLQETFAAVVIGGSKYREGIEVRAAIDVSTGAVFRSMSRNSNDWGARLSDRSVAELVKTYASRAGLDPKLYAGHSLRAGFATSAALAGKTDRAIMRQTGHKSAAMLERYVREVGLFDDNAAVGLL
jgi:site-specific recombinase XerD